MTWRSVKLDDLGTVARGRSKHRPRNDPLLFGGDYPFFQTGDVKAANLWLSRFETTYNAVGLAQSKLWPPGTLCITIAANIAESAVLAVSGCFPDSVVGFTPHQGVSDVLFVKYLLDHVKLRMQSISQGTTQDNLSLDKLLSISLDVPDYERQRRIARVLAAYDELLENNARRIQILERMAQAIYRGWFVEFRYPGYRRVALVESDLGVIPDGWRWADVRELAEEVRRGVDPTSLDPGTPYFGLEHLPEHSIAISSWGRALDAGSRKYRFEDGEILFGKIRPYFHKVGIPPVSGICSTDAIVIRPLKWAGLVLAVVSSEAFVQQAVQTSQGTKMPRANWSVLERYPVAIPRDERLLARFDEYMANTVALVHQLIMVNRNLLATRDLLLPRLISGEIDVASLDLNDENAAA